MLKKTFAASALTAAAAGVLLMGAPAYAIDDVDEIETSGEGSILGGTQVVADADIPINVCGIGVAVIGIASGECEDSGAAVIENEENHHGW